MKDSHPLHIDNYAKARGVDHELGFAWLVLYMLKTDAIIEEAWCQNTNKF